MEDNTARFARAIEAVARFPEPAAGIGTLSEGPLHAVLKEYYCGPGTQKEVPLGTHVADLWDGRTVIEIQTRALERLRGKLTALLPLYTVRVVHPIARHKWLVWVDEDTGASLKGRRSPKTGMACSALPELYKLGDLLRHPNLRLSIPLIDLEEHRCLNGWSADRKKGSTRLMRVPVALHRELTVDSPAQWNRLLPEGLPRPFTAKDFCKAAKLSVRGRSGWSALKVLEQMGVVTRCGKQGSAILWETVGQADC